MDQFTCDSPPTSVPQPTSINTAPPTLTASSASPGSSCRRGESCTGGAMCSRVGVCMCPDGMKDSNGQCVALSSVPGMRSWVHTVSTRITVQFNLANRARSSTCVWAVERARPVYACANCRYNNRVHGVCSRQLYGRRWSPWVCAGGDYSQPRACIQVLANHVPRVRCACSVRCAIHSRKSACVHSARHSRVNSVSSVRRAKARTNEYSCIIQ
jgi:hypothetical protein